MTTDRLFYTLGVYTVLSPAVLLALLALPSLVGRPLPERMVNRLIQFAVATGLVASLSILSLMLATGARHVSLELGHWVNLEAEHFHFHVKFEFDRLSVPFVILTYSLCGTISAFAHSYLHREHGFNRFFVCFALFLLGMIIASVAGTIEMLFAGWELVGLASALLVAFFHERQSPVRNGLRVWTVYRVADAAFLVAVLAMHHLTGEGDFDKLMGAGAWPAGHASMTPNQALFIGLLLLIAAAGKSALVPFSGWLPRAMEGPTPSSAVFYGALSVHLGAFLLLRISPILDLSPTLSAIVVLEGLATAVFAALASRVQADIKTSLAFASLTQVGIIVAEIGLGLRYIPLIHIIGHACLRTLQLVRAPTLLHDYHQLENAIGGHLPQRPTMWQRIVPEKFCVRVYRFALERGFFDAMLNDYVVRPFMQLFPEMRRAGAPLDRFYLRACCTRVRREDLRRRRHRRAPMSELHLPWLELAIVLPAVGAALVARLRDPERAQARSLMFSGAALACAVGAWLDFGSLHTLEAHDRWSLFSRVLGFDPLAIDELSAPLLPMAALICFVTSLATLRTKIRRFSFSWSLISEAILLATLSCRSSWGIIALLTVGVLPPLVELRTRRKPIRVFALHMAFFVGMLVVGWALVERTEAGTVPSTLALSLLIAAIFIRSGVAPLHCWMTDLFEHASFGRALLFVTPMVGVYAAVRLLLPIAPEGALRSVAFFSLFTAVYAAGMALVQREARRFFCYLFLSHSSLVLVGLALPTPIGLTAALCLWISVGLALTGFGLTLRSIEARTGRVSLTEFHGLYEHTPALAVFFLLTGLASIGFPGTIGFVGAELLVEGAVDAYPWVGFAVVLAAALNGIAVLQAYFRVFTGKRYFPTISLQSRLPERIAVLVLAALIVYGGIYPQPGLSSRYHAAVQIIEARRHLPGPPVAQQARRRHAWFGVPPVIEATSEVQPESEPGAPQRRPLEGRASG